jgi:magnesium-transporting ATPase (P-type)
MSAKSERMTEHGVTWHEWVSWIGIVVALIGFFFWAPIGLGIVGAILGIIAVSTAASTQQKTWSWISIIVGVIVLILGLFGWTVASI